MVCGGIWMFFMLERILKFIMDYKDVSHFMRYFICQTWSKSQFLKINVMLTCSHVQRKDRTMNREKIPSVVSSTSPENNSAISMLVENGNCIKISDLANLSNGSMGCNSPISEPEVVYECQEQAIKASFGHQEVHKPNKSESPSLFAAFILKFFLFLSETQTYQFPRPFAKV